LRFGLVGALLLLATVVLAETPPAAQKCRIEQVGPVDSSKFPEITLQFRVVDEQGNAVKQLPYEQFVIYEDGKEVHRFLPSNVKAEPVSVVLAMDTSGSMERKTRGAASAKLQAAKTAAGRFFTKLDAPAPCGLVLFNHAPYHTEPLTKDRGRLHSLVEGTIPRGGTAYFDATSVAIRMLAASPDPGQRVAVVMTDGRDVNSKRGLAEVIQEAQQQRVRVYTIGLGEPGHNDLVRTVLVLDRSGSMAAGKKIEALRKAATRFVELMPPESADSTIIAFDSEVVRSRPFTNQRGDLQQQITRLTPGEQTALYDGAYEGLETLNAGRDLEKGPTRRSLVVLSDGEDTSSRRTDNDVIARAKADGVKIYVLGLGQQGEINEPVMQRMARETGGEYFRVVNPDELTAIFEELSIRLHDDGIDEASLRALARDTGGQYFHVQDADQLSLNFERVAQDLETVYSVSFKSPRSRHDGTARPIEIRLGDLAVGRAGYATHGLITPSAHPLVYLGLLILLLALLAIPAALRRLGGSSPTA
jgi:VWFA-related protein